MASKHNQAIRRLMKDLDELRLSPVSNVSAEPLESNMFEWHCNIQQDSCLYHVILFFPPNYPYSSPSAEFVPWGFNYNQGATKRGNKGDQICLSIFSDYATYHSEWADDTQGWSPGYSAQTVLLNVISFLAEAKMTDGPDATSYQALCKSFECQDCGHKFTDPYPAFKTVTSPEKTRNFGRDTEEISKEENISLQIIDYISKEKFHQRKSPSDNELFGYGVVVTQRGNKSTLTTPCEFLTSATFYGMQKSVGVIHSVLKEKLSHFLPLYINKTHGRQIRNEFQKTLKDVKPLLFPRERNVKYVDIILRLIPNLMCSTVVEFSKGSQHTSDNSLQGYFALHHLFLWAMDTYPELENEVEKRLSSFVTEPLERTKTSCPDIGQLLMLLSVSKRFTWKNVADAYLLESYKRSVMWYVKSDQKLGSTSNTAKAYRLKRTFELTVVSRNLLAFQVAFLEIAKPDDMSRDQIFDRYEKNLGFPSTEMVSKMKMACERIKSKITNYGQWYAALGVPAPSMDDLHETLTESVAYANSTKGYFFTPRDPVPPVKIENVYFIFLRFGIVVLSVFVGLFGVYSFLWKR